MIISKSWMLAAILVASGLTIGCHREAAERAIEADNDGAPAPSMEEVIDKYLADSIGSRYGQGEVCIPVVAVTDVDSTDMADVKAWGDYWVFNYNVVGDTLKMVSGGNHPGLLHLRRTDLEGFAVVAFEQVEDGANYDPSAKRIFGDHYEAFKALNGDEAKREALRKAAIANFVERNHLNVKLYQDHGWPAHSIAD